MFDLASKDLDFEVYKLFFIDGIIVVAAGFLDFDSTLLDLGYNSDTGCINQGWRRSQKYDEQ